MNFFERQEASRRRTRWLIVLQGEGRVSLQNYVLRKLAQVHLNDDLNPLARDQLAPIMKEPLVEALVKTVTHDQKLTLGEAELLRAVCAAVHCPLPPLVGAGDPNR